MSFVEDVKYTEDQKQPYPYRFHFLFQSERGTSTTFHEAKAAAVKEYTDRCMEIGERGHDWTVAKFYRELYVYFVKREHAMMFKLTL